MTILTLLMNVFDRASFTCISFAPTDCTKTILVTYIHTRADKHVHASVNGGLSDEIGARHMATSAYREHGHFVSTLGKRRAGGDGGVGGANSFGGAVKTAVDVCDEETKLRLPPVTGHVHVLIVVHATQRAFIRVDGRGYFRNMSPVDYNVHVVGISRSETGIRKLQDAYGARRDIKKSSASQLGQMAVRGTEHKTSTLRFVSRTTSTVAKPGAESLYVMELCWFPLDHPITSSTNVGKQLPDGTCTREWSHHVHEPLDVAATFDRLDLDPEV